MKIVSAAETVSLTVITFNLWGYGVPAEYLKRRGIVRGAAPDSLALTVTSQDAVWKKRRAYLTRIFQETDPDLIAVQENVRRPGAPDRSHARQLAKSLGMEVVEGTFYPIVDSHGQTVEVGLAVLSHLPVLSVRETELNFGAYLELGGIPRMLQVELDADEGPVQLWNVHLPAREETAKERCARTIMEQAALLPPDADLWLCGDFNAGPDSSAMRILLDRSMPVHFLDAWASLRPEDPGCTMPSHAPEARLDYLLHRPDVAAFHPCETELLGTQPDPEGFYPSDHCGLLVRFGV